MSIYTTALVSLNFDAKIWYHISNICIREDTLNYKVKKFIDKDFRAQGKVFRVLTGITAFTTLKAPSCIDFVNSPFSLTLFLPGEGGISPLIVYHVTTLV